MGMKNLMCEILADKQKEYIKSLSEQLKHKNELVIKESRRANEMFQLSYNRKLKIEEQQAEINRLREENAKMFNLLEMVARGITLYCDTEDVIKITSDVKKFCIAKHESEGK